MSRKFWATTFTLTGATIGAGILGLPYVFSQSGILIGLFWIIFLGTIMIYTNLCLGEVALRTKGKHQLIGYTGIYLGKIPKRIMLFAVVFGIYSALIAYLIGESQSLSYLFTGSTGMALYFALGFWLLMTLLLREGLKGLKKVELWGVIGIIILVLSITIYYSPQINFSNYCYNNFDNLFLPFGVVLFALLGFTAIPELRMEIKGDEKKLKRAIMFGTFISIIVYIIFSLVFVGVLGTEVSQVATLSLGKLVILLGIFTMLTSYFVLSFALKDIFSFDLGYSKTKTFLLTAFLPLVAYLVLYFVGQLNFITVLGIGGVISGGLTGILILQMNKNAKVQGKRKPEYEIPINLFVIVLLSIIFLMGIFLELGF
ncbi:hypothetical protein HOE04_00120 [archaeon]|jgi:amino acid permease|nr:hypothetical protein [archaeon]